MGKSYRKKVITLWLLLSSPFIVLSGVIYLTSIGFFGALPTFDQLENPKNNLATEIISHDGIVLGKYFYENRSNTKHSELPTHLINAAIATEDIRFHNHSGIDAIALLRAVRGQLLGGNSGGASTISQQLAKMLFTERPASGFERIMQKFKEWVIAVRLEKQYTKEEIMTMYFNKFDFVNNAVGIKSASQVYFNTTPSQLSQQEAAMLVGMFKNPSLYNPNRRVELTTNRRNVVLDQMSKYNFITKRQADSLKSLPIVLDFKKADHNEGLAPYLREYLRGELKKWCQENKKADGTNYNLYTDGLKIYTGINSRMQSHAEQALKSHLASLQKDFDKHWKGYSNAPFPKDFSRDQINTIIDQAMRRSERYRLLKKAGKSKKEIKKIFDKKVAMSIFSWKGEIDTIMSPRDSIKYYKFFI